ncbi:MAG: hypothetical protein E6I33_01085 [Chloroflexi bacterium]|nr:MAG: hypothetical protein E6I33_01085 [Chloroflexota bacterium]
MADEPKKDDEDVEGHRFTSKNPDEEKKSSPERFTSKTEGEDEDDVEGHRFTSNTPDEKDRTSAPERFTS